MSRPRWCRVCRVVAPGAELPVLAPGHALQDWHLCGRCWALLELGVPLWDPTARLAYFTDRRGLLLTTGQVWGSIQLALRGLFPPHGQTRRRPREPGDAAWPDVTEWPASDPDQHAAD